MTFPKLFCLLPDFAPMAFEFPNLRLSRYSREKVAKPHKSTNESTVTLCGREWCVSAVDWRRGKTWWSTSLCSSTTTASYCRCRAARPSHPWPLGPLWNRHAL